LMRSKCWPPWGGRRGRDTLFPLGIACEGFGSFVLDARFRNTTGIG
jgi:hypothetical protein